MSSKRTTLVLLSFVVFLSGSVLQETTSIASSHCNYYPGGDAGQYYIGTDGCDHFEVRGGRDKVEARDNPCCSSDDHLQMGAGDDDARGQAGPDIIYGGDNDPDRRELLKGGEANDALLDRTGRDKDLACGGDNTDQAEIDDDDGLDAFYGDSNNYGHEDIVYKDNLDEKYLDGQCPVEG